MTIRVIQWATGGVGRAAVEAVVSHPDLELVGARVYSPDKVGRDVGELCGLEPLGVEATDDVDALLALEPDCCVYAPILPDEADLARLLRAGVNVVTPLGWFFQLPHESQGLRAAAEAGGATLHGTGIHPGGVTERLPLVASAFSRNITHVRAEEFSDIRSYGAPDVIRNIMLFGVPPEEASGSFLPAILGNGFNQSISMLAHALGFRVDEERVVTHETAVATAPIDSPIGVIEPGLVAAQRISWQATVDGKPVITARVNWLMGEEHLDPAWSFGREGERFEVEVDGDPPTELVIHGWHPDGVVANLDRNLGIVATGVHCVSAVPAVVAAPPGLVTYLDLPMVHGRAAPDLHR
ncbi:MAG: hypothetical protein R3249_09750 [Nitriliruptorales bacterium]|nr:hypothetical protein [Nitriliruptorales bacterium]